LKRTFNALGIVSRESIFGAHHPMSPVRGLVGRTNAQQLTKQLLATLRGVYFAWGCFSKKISTLPRQRTTGRRSQQRCVADPKRRNERNVCREFRQGVEGG